MTDEFEAKPGTAVHMPLLSEALINFAFNQAQEFVESGNSVREATSICANLLLDAAWKVAGAGAAADGFEPNKDKFRARVEDVLERVSFSKVDDEHVSSEQPSANPAPPPPSTHDVDGVQALLHSLDRTAIAKIVDPSAWVNEGGYDIEQEHSGPALIAADQIITYVLRKARALATTEGSTDA